MFIGLSTSVTRFLWKKIVAPVSGIVGLDFSQDGNLTYIPIIQGM